MKPRIIKLLRLLGPLVVFAMTAVSCGDLAPDSLAYASDDADVATESVIRLATPSASGLKGAIADWEREHPTARVEIVVRSLDDHHRSVLDNAGAGGTFDIIGFDASYGPDIRQRSELFIDLSSFQGDVAEYRYLPSRWNEGIANDGQLIGLPIDVDGTALAVRTDLVDASIIDRLENAETWCDLLVAGNEFSEETGVAFLPDGDELFTTMLSQNRMSFIDESGNLITNESVALEQAWDLTMAAIGAEPLHGNACESNAEIDRIARNLDREGTTWRQELRNNGFAAVLANFSDLRDIAVAAPDTAGDWTIIELPGEAGASSGGIHLALSAASPHPELAFDLISYLADPTTQQDVFANGSGPFPSASILYGRAAITSYANPFFSDAPIGTIFSSTAQRRPTELAEPLRRIAVEQFVSAVNRVETRDQDPGEAWEQVRWQIEQFLG